MSNYTTGEVAKMCGVTVRTVQYYDNRGLLMPSALSEGGRRLYSEDDVRRMKVICFLRELGLPINSIGQLLAEEDPGSVISILLEQQEQVLRFEMEERKTKLTLLEELRRELKNITSFSVESIHDIAYCMENKKKMRRVRITLFLSAIPMELLEIALIVVGVAKGMWWLTALGFVLVALWGVLVSAYYFKNVAYICPQCHTVFKPTFKEAFWARHTPKTRRLTCTSCGHKGFCVETYGGKDGANNG